jgi:general stress protein YciG
MVKSIYHSTQIKEVLSMLDEKQMSLSEAGHKGGTTTAKRYGPEFYKKIGQKGGQRVRELIAAGRAAQAADTQDQKG